MRQIDIDQRTEIVVRYYSPVFWTIIGGLVVTLGACAFVIWYEYMHKPDKARQRDEYREMHLVAGTSQPLRGENDHKMSYVRGPEPAPSRYPSFDRLTNLLHERILSSPLLASAPTPPKPDRGVYSVPVTTRAQSEDQA